MHKSLTPTRIERAAKRMDGTGFCIYCGKSAGGVEPDARKYPCDNCDKPGVYGAEELFMMVAF